KRIDDAVGADLRWLGGAYGDAKLRILANHQRLGIQIAAGEIAEIEDRLRDDAGDDAGIEHLELQAGHIEELRKPDRIFVGGAVRFRRGAPLRDPSLAVMDGEKAVGIALLNGKKHGSAPPAPL